MVYLCQQMIIRFPILLYLIRNANGYNDTTFDNVDLTINNESNMLYCKCGMDHSDPFAKQANTDCKTIQYDAKSQGVDGIWTGITIVNRTTCSINLTKNPNGICQKVVTAHNEKNNMIPTSKHFSHIEILWTCRTHRPDKGYPANSCAKRVDIDTFCCNQGGHSCENGGFCGDGKKDYGNFCNDHHRTKIEEAFWRDRTLKRAKRALYIIIILILAGVGISWITYRRNPSQVQQFMIALLGKCCNLFGTRMNTDAMPGSFRPSFSNGNQDQALINETNGDSQCTKETYLADIDDTGSGVGPTWCVQRTIARQIRSMERVGNGRYGTVFKGEWQGELVAMKKFHTTEEKSWNREVELYNTQALAHDNILRFIAADNRDNGVQIELWLVTEYHENGSLYDYLSTHKLIPERCLRMALSIASGVEHLHKKIQGTLTQKNSIAHRDIKSKNILVKQNMDCCIADLGLACQCGPNGTLLGDPMPLLDQRQTVGTVRYLAPEYLKPELFNDYLDLTKADIYSTALVFWELLNRTEGFMKSVDDIPEYNQPYWDMVPSEPSIDDMKAVVVAVPIRRPFIPQNYSQQVPCLDLEKANPLLFLAGVVRECWQERPLARLTALRLKKDLRQLVSKQFSS